MIEQSPRPPQTRNRFTELSFASVVEKKEKTIAEYIAERHPDWPPIKLKFYFGQHDTFKDMVGMKNHVKKADISFYESDNKEDTQMLQKLANADPDQLPSDRFDQVMKKLFGRRAQWNYNLRIKDTVWDAMFQSLYGSKNIIGGIDIRPEDSPTRAEMHKLIFKPYVKPDFDKTLEALKTNEKKSASQQHIREDRMTNRFPEELEKIMIAHPELKDKPDITILFTLGAYHTSLFHKFESQGVDTKDTFSRRPYVFDYRTQLAREIAFGKEPDRDLLAKAYLSDTLYTVLTAIRTHAHFDKSNDEEVLYTRQIASFFTTEEIEKIHKYRMKMRFRIGASDKTESLTRVLNEALHDKDLAPLPLTSQEVHERVVKQEKGRIKQEVALRRIAKATMTQRRSQAA